MDKWIEWMTDGWINGSIHRWMELSNERKMRREGIQGTSNEKNERVVGAVWGEWRKMRGNAVKEHYFQISCGCVIYLVDGAQSKCKRKCWFVFYAFLWTCRETVKSQASEIVYCTHAGALKWYQGRSQWCQQITVQEHIFLWVRACAPHLWFVHLPNWHFSLHLPPLQGPGMWVVYNF